MFYCIIMVCLAGCSAPNSKITIPDNQQDRERVTSENLPIKRDFQWPKGIRAAVSLTYDDGYTDQVDHLIALIDSYGFKGSFYLLDCNLVKRLDAWRKAAANGHEIGNHSFSHNCTVNYELGSLEDSTLESIAKDLDAASENIYNKLGVWPVTFAYPCGQKYVGRGRNAKSYIPVVAERFLVGRGYLEETPNKPGYCDLANVNGTKIDSIPFEKLKAIVDSAAEKGQWVCFSGHGVGPKGSPSHTILDQLCKYLSDPNNGFWVDTIGNIGVYVYQQRINIKNEK